MFIDKKYFILFYFILSLIFSCKKKELAINPIERVLVLGNSITIHPPSPSVEWHADWGMAASRPENDFTHLLADKMDAKVEAVNISAWERSHHSYDLSTLDPYLQSKQDYILVRLGENVNDQINFEQSFSKLIDYMIRNNSTAKILITGTFWKNEPVDDILLKVAKGKNIPFVPLSQLDRSENRSYIGATIFNLDGSSYKIVNQGVADHPGDLGMEQIANTIYIAIRKHYKE